MHAPSRVPYFHKEVSLYHTEVCEALDCVFNDLVRLYYSPADPLGPVLLILSSFKHTIFTLKACALDFSLSEYPSLLPDVDSHYHYHRQPVPRTGQ